jgi:hypothetical protein
MRLHRFIIASLCLLPVLIVLYAFIESWSADWMPQDPPLPFRWAVVMWFIRLALWPFCVYDLIFQRDPSGIAFLVMLLITALFWGFIIELLFMLKRRLWPNLSPEPSAVGAESSATRATSGVGGGSLHSR